MDPPFLSAPVGCLIEHDTLSDDVAGVWTGQFPEWHIAMDAVNGSAPVTSWAIELVQRSGRREARRFELAGPWPPEGQPLWRRVR